MTASIRCWPALPRHAIAPEIYGIAVEHAGRCVYEGLWVGKGSSIPNRDGVRLDMLAALAHLRVPVVSWPGGAFAQEYHWRDGLGAANERRRTANAAFRQIEPNTFGTEEFLGFCRAVGAAPCLCVNTSTGTPREARDWLEYCSFPGDSSLASFREQNGSPQPHHVPFWRLGCAPYQGGRAYAERYTRFSDAMSRLSPEIRLSAGLDADGTDSPAGDWLLEFCRSLSLPFIPDSLSLQHSFSKGGGVEFSSSDYYESFQQAQALDRRLEKADAILRYCFPDRQVGIAVDGWGMRHPEADMDGGMEQPRPLRDALLAASVLHLLNRRGRRISRATLCHAINSLHCLAVTEENRMFLTPTYHVFDMMRPHQRGRLLMSETEGPEPPVQGRETGSKASLPLLDACASLSGRKITLSVINKSWDMPVETLIDIREAVVSGVTGKALQGDSPHAQNSFEAPSQVTARRIRPELHQGRLVHVFPPHSFTVLSIALEA